MTHSRFEPKLVCTPPDFFEDRVHAEFVSLVPRKLCQELIVEQEQEDDENGKRERGFLGNIIYRIFRTPPDEKEIAEDTALVCECVAIFLMQCCHIAIGEEKPATIRLTSQLLPDTHPPFSYDNERWGWKTFLYKNVGFRLNDKKADRLYVGFVDNIRRLLERRPDGLDITETLQICKRDGIYWLIRK